MFVLAVSAYAIVEIFDEGKMPALFNPASIELTGGYGLSVLALLTLYSLGLILTAISFSQPSLNFKKAIPWITIPLLAPIDLLAAFQSLYVLKFGIHFTKEIEKVDITSTFTVNGGNYDSYLSWVLSCNGDKLYSARGPFS